MACGTAVAVGLAVAPDMIDTISRQASRFALRESAARSHEALASVQRRYESVIRQLAQDELFLARVAAMSGVPIPEEIPGVEDPGEGGRGAETLESRILTITTRLRSLEFLRREIAAAPARDGSLIPSRSPVEVSSAVPVLVYGRSISPVTRGPEFFPGLLLGVPRGTFILAPADGTVIFQGSVPASLGARWRSLGQVLLLGHGPGMRTVYGHIEKALVKRGQKVRRGQRIGIAGTPDFGTGNRVYYGVFTRIGGGFVPADPRIYVLDANWISMQELRSRPKPPAETYLSSDFH